MKSGGLCDIGGRDDITPGGVPEYTRVVGCRGNRGGSWTLHQGPGGLRRLHRGSNDAFGERWTSSGSRGPWGRPPSLRAYVEIQGPGRWRLGVGRIDVLLR